MAFGGVELLYALLQDPLLHLFAKHDSTRENGLFPESRWLASLCSELRIS